MFFQPLDLTTALRPSLLPDEVTLFVQESIGLYEGYRCLLQASVPRLSLLMGLLHRKYKLPDFQHGHAYLTTHRICYVDNEEPRKYAGSIELKAVDRYDYYVSLGRFLTVSVLNV